uniref:Uncharacterized protein n=1 Tax=Arundo donax TaxID=35708 RepID=A0A0A8ZF65_ARUDO
MERFKRQRKKSWWGLGMLTRPEISTIMS